MLSSQCKLCYILFGVCLQRLWQRHLLFLYQKSSALPVRLALCLSLSHWCLDYHMWHCVILLYEASSLAMKMQAWTY